MKFRAGAAGAAIIFATSSVWAAKYIVVFKETKNFAQVHSQWVLSNQSVLNRMFSDSRASLEVVESLQHVQSVVVESQDENLVSAMVGNSDAIIEKEMFYKTPTPVENFELTEPWSFDARYAVPAEAFNQARAFSGSQGAILAGAVGAKTPWGISAVKAREAWAISNQGFGARVLVLDTGIDRDHPSLKNKIEASQDFVDDGNAPYPVADKVGHGTHVAGTIAADEAADGFTGVAPRAQILVGRVCGLDGCSSISIARGINWGIEKKVDVINMSLGGQTVSESVKMAVSQADRAGVVIVAASGNDGTSTVSYPAALPTVVAVGAVDSKISKASFSQWGPELDVVAPGVDVVSSVPLGTGCEASAVLFEGSGTADLNATCFSGSAFLNQGLRKDLVFVGLGKPDDFNGKDLSGKFALISRGEIKFIEKVQNAMAARANGVIIFNNTPGLMGGSLTDDGSTLAIPVVMIEQTAGERIKASLEAGKAVSLEVKTANADYAAFSGTSMATPHTAGVVALIRGTKKSLAPQAVRDLLKATATPLGPNTQNEFGSGLVDAEKAVTKASQMQ